MVTGGAGRRTRRLAIVLASASVLVVGASLPAAYAIGDNGNGDPGKHRRFDIALTGAKERPGPGDADGRGRAQIRLKKDQVCFDLSWRDIGAPTAAHIHRAPRTDPGQVVVGLFNVPDGLEAPVSKVGGCAPAEAALIAEIREQPGAFYVNIHNAEFPAGAIRGQLHR